jgi:SAM-dependent methyltransferase/GT2 family glycosyltransferase
MIIVGVCVRGSGEQFEAKAGPALRRVLGPEDRLVTRSGDGMGIAVVYNEVIAQARSELACEGVVLLHDDVEVLDPDFRAKTLAALREPYVGVVGVVGGRGLVDAKWWNARVTAGRVFESRHLQDLGPAHADVDVVDGLFLALAPAAVARLNVDDGLPLFHGYDVDLCLQARDLGLRVVVRQIDLLHRTKGGFGDKAAFAQANDRVMERHAAWFTALSLAERARPLVRAGQRNARSGARRALRYAARVVRRPEQVSASDRVSMPPNAAPEAALARCVACGESLAVLEETGSHGPSLLPCTRCGSKTVWPPPGRQVETDGLWEQRYGGQRLARRPDWFAEARQRLDWILLLQPEGVLVEVGSGTGEFAKVALDAGFDTYAVEPSLWAAHQAGELGVRVHTGTLAGWRQAHPGLQADVVALWHVLEHAPDPLDLIRDVAAATRPGGYVAVEVPNGMSSECERLGVQWDSAQPDDHVILFSPQGLRMLTEAAGLEVVELLEISDRLYAGGDAWRRRRNTALVGGYSWPPKDLLRMVARRPVVQT